MKVWLIEHLRSFYGNCRIYRWKYLARREWPAPCSWFWRNFKMTMVYTLVNFLTIKNMELESTTTKMETCMKDKCLRDLCKEKANTRGKMVMFMREHLQLTKWTDMESWHLPTETYTKDSSWTTRHAAKEKWWIRMVKPMRVVSSTICAKAKENNTWRMVIFSMANFSKENGMEGAR